ncbi:MAG: transposase [Parcubacteria group bacterium]|nr:transposase [Parcubacteria group bacterium]
MISEQAKERCRILAFWEKHGDEAAKEAFAVSRRTLFRWACALRADSGKLEALNAKSRAPKRLRTRNTPEQVKDRVIALRTAHLRLGKDKIHAILMDEGYRGSVSTVGRILGDLKKRGRIPTRATLTVSARTGRLIERTYTPRRKLRRPKGYRVLETDTVVRFIDGMKRYVLTGIDTESRVAFAGAYTNHGSASAADFLRKTRAVLPSCPTDVQTDNGSEFALHFHRAVEASGLHFNTHPHSPKENAHVERFNRTLDEEFLRPHRDLLRDDVAAFNEKLVDWLLWYNGERPHHALGQRSPLCAMMSSLPAEECQMWWTHTAICFLPKFAILKE